MKVRDLAKIHLDVDITKEDFWTAGIQLMAMRARQEQLDIVMVS